MTSIARRYWALLTMLVIVIAFRFTSAFKYGDVMLACNLSDDGCYYYQIAGHIAQGQGSTFDGVSRTNGYQPLWMAVMVPALRVFHPVATHGRLILFSAINFAAFVVLALLLWNLLNGWFGFHLANVGVLILGVSKFTTTFIGGTEAPLLAIVLVLLLMCFDRMLTDKSESTRSDWQMGVLGGLLILTRLDYVVVYGVLLLCVNYYRWEVRRLVPLVLPAAIMVAGYSAINLLLFGHLLPISGALKILDFPARSFGAVMTFEDEWTRLLAASNLLILIILFAWRGQPDRTLAVLRSWSLANVAYLLFLFFSVRETGKWYYVSPILLTVVFAVWLVARLQDQWRWRPAIAAGVLSILVIMMALVSNYRRVEYNRRPTAAYSARFQFVNWCNEHLLDTAVIATPDAGFFAFASRHRVINTDGLVNDWEYARACREGRAVEVLKSRGVDYVATAYGSHVWDDPSGVHHYNVATLHPQKPGNACAFTDNSVIHELEYEGDRLMLWTMREPLPNSPPSEDP